MTSFEKLIHPRRSAPSHQERSGCHRTSRLVDGPGRFRQPDMTGGAKVWLIISALFALRFSIRTPGTRGGMDLVIMITRRRPAVVAGPRLARG